MALTVLEKRCVELSYKHKLTHVSSVLNSVELIARIYGLRNERDPFVLGNSHAALALYVVLESRGKCDAEDMIKKHGTHASRDMEHGIWVSGGSLGQPETIAVGLALADPMRDVWVVTSDGACAEGSVWETMRFANRYLTNLKVYVVFNGYGAYGIIYEIDLPTGVRIHPVNTENWPVWLRGLSGHYITLNTVQYDELMK